MTGYGRSRQVNGGMDITVELRSVNHRYYEYGSRIPRVYGFLDEQIKPYLQTRVSRGKVDVGVWIETVDAPGSEVLLNHTLAAGYLAALRELAERYRLENDVAAAGLARLPDVMTVRQTAGDEAAVWVAVRPVLDAALEQFLMMREREGDRLREDIRGRGRAILGHVADIEARAPAVTQEHMERMTARIRELLEGAEPDERRLLTEAAVFADKTAVDEETVRLRSHLAQLDGMLDEGEPVGRKLDFLVQEINREANTIGSKSQDVALTRTVVDIKADIEKIREQVQNIE